MRTKEFKNNLYEKNKTILEIIYYLGNGIMLSEQLIKFMAYIEPLNTKTKENINELITEGFLKEKQVLYNNKYVLYLTKYPISKIRGIESRNATSIRPSTEKILNSLYKTELLLTMISKTPNKVYTVNNILSRYSNILTNKNNALEIYNVLEKSLIIANPTPTFYLDKKNHEYNNLMRFKKDNSNINKELKKAKEQTVKAKQSFKGIDELKAFYNISNLLNRGFVISGISYTDGEMSVTVNYIDITETDIYKIYFNLGCIYNMFKNYFKGEVSINNSSYFLNLNLKCIVNTANVDRAKLLKEDAESKVPDLNGGFREYKKGKNTLIRAGVPQMYLSNIQVLYRNLDFQNKYNIDLS